MPAKTKIICDNSYTRPGQIVGPQCAAAPAILVVTVNYDEDGIERDTLNLCQSCFNAVASDALRHGYSVTSRSLKKG